MDTSQIIERIRSRQQELRERGILSLSVFGSRARGDHKPDSDLDILIDYDPSSGFSLIDVCAVERILREDLGLPVQATTRNALRSWLRRKVERDEVKVF
jgi:predicted nucleotidyltransferase